MTETRLASWMDRQRFEAAVERHQRLGQVHDRTRVGLNVASQPEVLARQHHGRAVVAHRSADQRDVAVPDVVDRRLDARQAHANASRREINAAALAAAGTARSR